MALTLDYSLAGRSAPCRARRFRRARLAGADAMRKRRESSTLANNPAGILAMLFVRHHRDPGRNIHVRMGVELGKKLAFGLLGREGYEAERKQVLDAEAARVRHVCDAPS